jgi:hypothetical protein
VLTLTTRPESRARQKASEAVGALRANGHGLGGGDAGKTYAGRATGIYRKPAQGLPYREVEPWNDGALPPLCARDHTETTPQRLLRPRGLPVGCLGAQKER